MGLIVAEAISKKIYPDKLIVLVAIFSTLAISLLLQYEFSLKQALFFLVGIGLGLSLMHAMFGFTGGWRMFIRSRHSVGVRAQILLVSFSSILFFPVVGGVFPELTAHAALGQIGVSV